MRSPSTVFPSGGVYCRETGGRWDEKEAEEGGARAGGGERKEAVPVLWHRLADPSVSVSSHSRNQFALCGTVDTERGKVSKHDKDTCKQQVQPGLTVS